MRYSLKLQCPLHRLKGKWNSFNATEQKASSFEKQNNEYILGHLGLLEPHSDSEMRREPKDKRRRVCSYNHIPLTHPHSQKTFPSLPFFTQRTHSSPSFSFNCALEGPASSGLVETCSSRHRLSFCPLHDSVYSGASALRLTFSNNTHTEGDSLHPE